MRWTAVVTGVLVVCLSLLASLKPTDEPARPEALSIQPEEAMDDLEDVGEEANQAIDEFMPDGPDHSRG